MSNGGKGSVARPFSVDSDTFASNWDRIFGKKKTRENCERCYNCLSNKFDALTGFPVTMSMMVVCEHCGNKRCPHATDHELACTGSNEPGQPGSRYE